jgi:D-alanine-D-alanine ligase
MTAPRDLVVLYGGPSAEHEVSCISALRIAQSARRDGKVVTAIGLTHDKRWVDAGSTLDTMDEAAALDSPDLLVSQRPELELAHLESGLPSDPVVFPLLHGPFGEDGVIQGHFETIGLPYVGAGVLSSAICMDKGIAKSVLQEHGLPVAAWRLIRRADPDPQAADEAGRDLGFPVFVKPANLGSSIGVSKVPDPAGLRQAVETAFEFDDYVIIEAFIEGRELELALLGNEEVRVTQAGEIEASREFYDYEDKYELGMAKTIVPTDLTAAQLARARELATRGYRALRVEGLARIDMFLAADHSFVINEVNTMPGFTPISMYPMLWAVEGLPLGALIDELVELALARHERRRGLRTHRLS